MKPKFEVQESHVSRKQYILHCGIVEPGETKYVYHLCDDATHDAAFVHFVLEDIFESCNIKNGNVLIKSYNAPTQYKKKYVFKSLQSLANKHNVAIVCVYSAAGHGKGLIDAMSSFGVKSVLRRDIVALDHWFANSLDICDYFTLRGEFHMSYNHIDSKVVDEARRVRESMFIDKYVSGRIFMYKLNSR